MSRHMSCALTVAAVRNRTKTVTRRSPRTWTTAREGECLTLVEKGMGLKKGEKVVRLAEVEIVDVRVEPLLAGLMVDDLAKEGIHADYTPEQWADWWATAHGWRRLLKQDMSGYSNQWVTSSEHGMYFLSEIQCRRIEWRYLDEATS